MNILKKISLIFLVMMLCFFVVLCLFCVTDQGTFLMLKTVTSHISGLKIGSISGNFINGITIKNFHYKKNQVLIQSSELYVACDLSCLLNKYFCVRTLLFKDLFVCIEFSQFKKVFLQVSDSNEIVRIIKMYPIIFRNIILHNVHIVFNGVIFKLSQCTTGLIWDKESFIIPSTFFSGLQLSNVDNFMKVNSISSIIQNQKISFQDIMSCKLFLSCILKNLSSKYFFKDNSTKSIISYPVIVEKVVGENLFFFNQKQYFIKKLYIQKLILQESIQLTLFNIIFSNNGEICIKGSIELNEIYSLNLIIDCFLPFVAFGKEKINFVISGSLNTMLSIVSKFSGVLNGDLLLNVKLTEVGVPLVLTLNIDSVDCSFINNFDYFLIRKLNFNLYGNYNDNYQLDAKFFVVSSQLSSSCDVTIHAIGNMNNLIISSLNLKHLTNNINIAGSIDYQDCLNWCIHLILKKIDITECVFIWPISLCGNINMKVNLSGNILRLKSFYIFLSGKIKNCHFVHLRGCFVKDILDSWIIPEFFVSIGSNIFKINGDFKDKSVVTTTINIVSINDIFPDLYGSVSGNIDVFHSSEDSKLLINIFVQSFCWGGHYIKFNSAIFRSNLQYKDILRGSLDCELDGLMCYSTFFQKIMLSLVGDEKNHNIECSICTNLLNVMVNIYGSMNTVCRSWCGNILKIICKKNMVDSNYIFDKRLVNLYYNLPDKLVVFSNSINGCMLQFNRGLLLRKCGIQGFVQCLQDFHLIVRQSFFIRSVKFNGTFMLCLDLFWDKYNFYPQGKILLSCKEIEWISVLQDKSVITFDDFYINFFLNSNIWCCNWLIKVRDYSQFSGILRVSPFDQYKLIGKIYSKNISLLFVNVFFESNNIVDGNLHCDLKLIGNLFYPKIYGTVELENVVFRRDKVPFMIYSSRLLMYFVKSRAILDGVMRTTGGMLYVTGDMYWNHIRSVCLRIHCMGQNIRTQLSSSINMDISPIIVFEITPLKCIFKGIVDISSADIELKKSLQDDRCNISPDEMILIHHSFVTNLNNINYKKLFVIYGNIIINFGDNVKIKSRGLNVKLHGSLRVIQDIHGLEIKGCIDIPFGNFNIYGQNLIIKKGQLLFSGLTTNNQPYLNIEAVYDPMFAKNSNTVLTSVQITGLINAPEVKFVSNYTMSQEEAISYFLSGQRLNMLNMNINNTIRSALIKFGLAYTENFVKKIGKVLGVKDLVFNTNGFSNKSQLVFSGYVTRSDLQIKYSFGIFDSWDAIVVRYCIFPNLYVEVVSGTSRTFDLVYHFDY